MESIIDEAHLDIVDDEGFVEFLMDESVPEYVEQAAVAIAKREKKSEEGQEFFKREMGVQYNWWKRKFKTKPAGNDVFKNGTIHYEAPELVFDEILLIGRWSPAFCLFLRDFAQFWSGNIIWKSEDGSEFVAMDFDGGEISRVQQGFVKWDEDKSIEEVAGLPVLPKPERFKRAL